MGTFLLFLGYLGGFYVSQWLYRLGHLYFLYLKCEQNLVEFLDLMLCLESSC